MSKSWKKIDSKTIFKHERIKLKEDKVRLFNGEETYYLRFDPHPSYSTVIPIDDQGRILLIKEYNYPTDKFLYQFAEGSCEEGEDPIETARRELQEEAGYSAKELNLVGTNYDQPKRTDAINYIVVATGLSEAPNQEGDAEEQGMTTHWFAKEEVWAMIARGEIVQKNATAAMALLHSKDLV